MSEVAVQGFCVDGKTCHRDFALNDAVKLLNGNGKCPVWLHLQVSDPHEVSQFLKEKLHFHELSVEDALSPNERPALTDFPDYLFLVTPVVLAGKGEEEYIELGYFLREKYLVTVADGPCPPIETWLERWEKTPMRDDLTAADILHILVDAVVDAYLPVIDGIEDEVDDIADSIFTGEKRMVQQLLGVKRRLLEMRRRVWPVRDVVNGLLRRDLVLIPDVTRPYFQDVYDHASRITESIDMQRDTLTSLLDVHLSIVSNNLNEVMKKMTVIATVLMSAALIAGIYGMNFKVMPELQWAYGYPFAVGLMVVSSGLILLAFKWKKWI